MGYTGPFPYTNNGTVTSVTVSGTTFSGAINNAGTISSGGITVIDSSFRSIFDEGFIAGGISIDQSSELDTNFIDMISTDRLSSAASAMPASSSPRVSAMRFRSLIPPTDRGATGLLPAALPTAAPS